MASTRTISRAASTLAQDGYAPGSIANKLTVLRRFYQAAVAAGFRQDNPATGDRPQREQKAPMTSACPRWS